MKPFSKKGIIEDIGDLFITFFLCAFVYFFLFTILSGHSQTANQAVAGQFQQVQADYLMLQIAQAPVEYQGQTITLTELISQITLEEGREERAALFRQATQRTIESTFDAQGDQSLLPFYGSPVWIEVVTQWQGDTLLSPLADRDLRQRHRFQTRDTPGVENIIVKDSRDGHIGCGLQEPVPAAVIELPAIGGSKAELIGCFDQRLFT